MLFFYYHKLSHRFELKGNKSWSVIKRETNDLDAGVGVNKYIYGTGP